MNKKPIVPDVVDRYGQDVNSPLVINSDLDVDNAPMGATLIDEEPIDGTFVAVDPQGEMIVYETPDQIAAKASLVSILNHAVSEHFRARWNELQVSFVDEPRSAVKQADLLVAEAIEKATQMFASEHSSLEGKWKQSEDATTEELRQALQSYRALFNRLVA